MKGKWRITQMPGYTRDYPDMMEPAYIVFDGKGGGEFVFGCVCGSIHGAGGAQADCEQFSWEGNDEMDPASGDGWAEIQPDGSIKGQICFLNGDEAEFAAVPWATFSAAC